MIWGKRTTRGGYGAPQSEEEALTLGLIRTSLMRIEIRQKKKKKVGAPHLDHDMPVFETSFKAVTAIASHSPPSSSLQNRFKQGRLVPLASFRSFLQLR